jgi:hypothetical protein
MSDKWHTNDDNFDNDIVKLNINGVSFDVADTYARKQLLSKITAPAGGLNGQVLAKSVSGYEWITVESEAPESVEYTAGEGITITDNQISLNSSVQNKLDSIQTYTAGAGITIEDGKISCTVTGGSGDVSYTPGNGISISGNTISVDMTNIAPKSHQHTIANITDFPEIPSISGLATQTYVDEQVDELQTQLNTKANASALFSKNYTDLTNKPKINGQVLESEITIEIPEMPETFVQSVNGKTGVIQLSATDVGALPSNTIIPLDLSDLTDKEKMIEGLQISISEGLAEKADKVHSHSVSDMTDIAPVAVTNNYKDLDNCPPTISALSELDNDTSFITITELNMALGDIDAALDTILGDTNV